MRGFTERAIDPVAELSINALAAEVRRASAWVEKACLERQVPVDQIARLDVCLNEVLANIIDYGGSTALSSPICLRLEVRRDHGGGEAALTVADAGAAFDPLTVSPPPRPAALADARPGGLGLTMIHSFADQLSYSHSEERNCLRIGVGWTNS